MDALHCQKETLGLINQRGGDFIVGLKGNQKNSMSLLNRILLHLMTTINGLNLQRKIAVMDGKNSVMSCKSVLHYLSNFSNSGLQYKV
ncbi:hypothetical protein XBJ2_1180002 [Xenorhabdus bovienii str. Jollieti]|uniref:Transposase n=1 Tax=Xenorhabdus bovienii (strain SS-2004) TaxID=406818 RepID=D3V3F9_XENBS|nr:hypothetical protein XBJ1_2148 [Xenorhabdus bovienii SS-2004]CDH27067.1 hypothetical protein XBJ2_1180002 [Xenorhabdus bovienii str. Jollieti]